MAMDLDGLSTVLNHYRFLIGLLQCAHEVPIKLGECWPIPAELVHRSGISRSPSRTRIVARVGSRRAHLEQSATAKSILGRSLRRSFGAEFDTRAAKGRTKSHGVELGNLKVSCCRSQCAYVASVRIEIINAL